jgi:hypothetical protein
MGEIADQMDWTGRAFHETTKRGIARRMDAGKDEIEQPASQRARGIQLTALDAADGRLGDPEQLGGVCLLDAAEPADQP